MQIKLVTTDRGIAEKLLLPLQREVVTLRDGGAEASIAWGEVEVERGALETIFELLGSIALGVGTGVIANWLWSHLQRTNQVRIEVTRVHHGVTQTIKIDCHSLEAMTAALSSALESHEQQKLESRNGEN